MKKIETIVVHCSDSGFGDAALIKQWHTSPPRNWKDIGYHYIILNGIRTQKTYIEADDGLIESGRNLDNNIWIETDEIGAHAKGLNENSIGVCLIGKDKFTERQFESLINLCQFFRRIIPGISIKGHYEVCTNKTCPNFDIWILNKILGMPHNISVKEFLGKYLK